MDREDRENHTHQIFGQVAHATLVKDVCRTDHDHLGKDKRLTLIECPDDACALIDLCKVADLVLLTVDASFGFEMVTFEALACLQAHGFPKVVGVLTHLDKMKTNKALQQVKKALKHRFWQDVYDGAKVFYIGGILQSGSILGMRCGSWLCM